MNNPFPSTAVARLSNDFKSHLTIETKALKEIKSHLEEYLKRDDDNGQVVCIIGEYGTGKTHLALEALKYIGLKKNPEVHTFYLDAPSDNFLELYLKRFIPRLNKKDVLDRIDEYYSDIVAEELKNDPIYKSLIPGLKERKIEANDVIQQIGLKESKLIRSLEEKLKIITKNPSFAQALLLAKNSNFEKVVWNWISGEEPTQALKERGITQAINDDSLALEAIGVLSFLFGFQNHRFVLIIDELEKVFSSSNFVSESSLLAFKKLFESIGKTKGLLILSGLPDFYEGLPYDAQQRITKVIKPTSLGKNEIASYIKSANKIKSGKYILKPFSSASVSYIADLANGNARQIIRLCYHSFHLSNIEKRVANKELVKEVAKELFEIGSKRDLKSEISHILNNKGWIFEQDKVLEFDSKKIVIDFWLPSDDEKKGVLVFVGEDIFSDKELNVFKKTNELLKKGELNIESQETVFITNGFVAENCLSTLNTIFDNCILYRRKHFINDVESIITGIKIRIAEESREEDTRIIKERIEQMERQISNMFNFIRKEMITDRHLASLSQQNARLIKSEIRKIRGIGLRKSYAPFLSNLNRCFRSFESFLFSPFRTKNFRDKSFDQINFFISQSLFNAKSIGNYFLVKELSYLSYNLILSYSKLERKGLNKYNIELNTFIDNFSEIVFKPLMSYSFHDSDGMRLLRRAGAFYDENNANREKSIKDLTLVFNKIESITYDFPRHLESINKSRYQDLAYAVDINDLTIANNEISYEFDTLMNRFTVIDNLLIEYYFLVSTENSSSLFNVNDTFESLRQFYALKNLLWLFMQTINNFLGNTLTSSISRVRNKDLSYFCELFEYDILRPIAKSHYSVIPLVKMLSYTNDYENQLDYEYEIVDLFEYSSKLPRITMNIIEESLDSERSRKKY